MQSSCRTACLMIRFPWLVYVPPPQQHVADALPAWISPLRRCNVRVVPLLNRHAILQGRRLGPSEGGPAFRHLCHCRRRRRAADPAGAASPPADMQRQQSMLHVCVCSHSPSHAAGCSEAHHGLLWPTKMCSSCPALGLLMTRCPRPCIKMSSLVVGEPAGDAADDGGRGHGHRVPVRRALDPGPALQRVRSSLPRQTMHVDMQN